MLRDSCPLLSAASAFTERPNCSALTLGRIMSASICANAEHGERDMRTDKMIIILFILPIIQSHPRKYNCRQNQAESHSRQKAKKAGRPASE